MLSSAIGSRKLYYGWVLVMMGMCIFAMSSGTVYYTFGVYLGPIVDEMGWSRGATSVAFSIFTIVNGGSGPFIAALIQRFGVRRVMLFGQLLLTAGLLALSQVSHLWHIHLLYGLVLGIGLGCSSYVSMATLMNTWFTRRRSLAMGLAMAGSGVGTLVMAPVIRYLIDVIGWRNSWLVLGAVAFVLAFIPTLLLSRNTPQEMGLQPEDAAAPPKKSTGGGRRVAYTTPVDWEARTAFRTTAFWLILLMAVANGFALSMLTSHQVVHLEDVGISPILAASAIGLMVAASAGGRVLGGVVGQWFPLRYVATVAFTFQVVGLVILLLARSLPSVYLYVFLYGPAYGCMVIMFPSFVGAYFGRKRYAYIFGTLFAMVSIVSSIAPMLAGFVFDATRSYTIPFCIAIGLCGLAALASLLAKPPVTRQTGTEDQADS